MLDLPMPAFKITGTGEFIELTIDEVFGFPNETSYGGGYGARGTLSIHAGEYSVSARHYFTTGELYHFLTGLEKCYHTLSGDAILENTASELELNCTFNKRGQVFVSGIFRADPAVHNVLSFEIQTDQTQVKDCISNLQTVYRLFGGHYGILRHTESF